MSTWAINSSDVQKLAEGPMIILRSMAPCLRSSEITGLPLASLTKVARVNIFVDERVPSPQERVVIMTTLDVVIDH